MQIIMCACVEYVKTRGILIRSLRTRKLKCVVRSSNKDAIYCRLLLSPLFFDGGGFRQLQVERYSTTTTTTLNLKVREQLSTVLCRCLVVISSSSMSSTSNVDWVFGTRRLLAMIGSAIANRQLLSSSSSSSVGPINYLIEVLQCFVTQQRPFM